MDHVCNRSDQDYGRRFIKCYHLHCRFHRKNYCHSRFQIWSHQEPGAQEQFSPFLAETANWLSSVCKKFGSHPEIYDRDYTWKLTFCWIDEASVAFTLLNDIGAMGGKFPSWKRLCRSHTYYQSVLPWGITADHDQEVTEVLWHWAGGTGKVPEIFLRPHNFIFSRFLMAESNLNFWQQFEYLIWACWTKT